MMRKFSVMLLLSIINLIALAFVIFNFLPEQIPTHIGLHGIDVYGPRWVTFIFGFIPVLSTICMIIYKKVTKNKEKIKRNEKVENIVLPMIIGLFLIITWLPVLIVISNGDEKILIPFICITFGAFMTLTGNYMGIVKQNTYLGIRVPWTLHNEEVWKRTHRISSYWNCLAGIIILITGITYYFFTNIILFIIGIILGSMFLVIMPVIYAYIIYKRLRKQENQEL